MEKKVKKMEEEKQQEDEKFDRVMATFQNETKDLQTSKFNKEAELLELQKSVNQKKQKVALGEEEGGGEVR